MVKAFSIYESPLGKMYLAAEDDALVGVWFDGQKYFDIKTLSGHVCQDVEVIVKTKKWLDAYFDGRVPSFCPNLKIEGSPFRREVLGVLLEIPYGKTVTYGQIAKEVARRMGRAKMSSQAVGGAVGHNPISLIVPCHRVIGSGGSLTGYAGGIAKKVYMLKLEKSFSDDMFVPKKGSAI